MNRLCSLGRAVAVVFALLLSQAALRGEVRPDFAHSLATNICSQCHLFPDPQLLDRTTWRDQVQPLMRKIMGVTALEKDPSTNAHILLQEWDAIWNRYYLPAAPEKPLPQDPRAPIVPDLALFKIEDPQYAPRNCYATLVKIDEQAHQLYVGNAITKSVDVLDDHGQLLSSTPVDSTLVHLLKQPDGWIGTQIGMVPPSSLPLGRVTLFGKDTTSFQRQRDLLTGLVRPVHTAVADLGENGRQDLVVCSFGYLEGKLSWYAPQGPTNYVEHNIMERPGSIISRVVDFNHDGKPDLVVLTAQAREGIFLYVNKGGGRFEEKPLVQQPPVWGYVYFEFDDFNGDGYPDLLTANGDLGDFACPPKKYHGIRIYLNDGHWNFQESYFYPLNGAFKCMAADFDGDGDLDIAAISFFPDYDKSPEESFVFLENQGGLKFKAHTFPESFRGRWMTMDVGDLDGDGDLDIVLGGAYKVPFKTPESFVERWKKDGPSVLILRNQLAQTKGRNRKN